MVPPEDLLLDYDDLTPEERTRADAYLEAHPQARARIEEGRRLRALFRLAASSGVEGGGGPVPEPPARRPLGRDPVARPRRWRPAWPVVGRGVAALLLLAAVFYGTLRVVGETARSPAERLAALEVLPPAYEPLRLRGAVGEAPDVTPEVHYMAGREALRAARRTVLGLFPRYDAARLEDALAAFDRAWAVDPEGPIGLEARFHAGRIHLHRGEVDAARAALEAVAARHGPRAAEARALLERMAAHGL